MLRPKQLLPLYKGARAFLVTGSPCGSKHSSLDGGGGSGTNHSDDAECDIKHQFRESPPSAISDGKGSHCRFSDGYISSIREDRPKGKSPNEPFVHRTGAGDEAAHYAHGVHSGFRSAIIQVPAVSDAFLKVPFSKSTVSPKSGVSKELLESSKIISPASRNTDGLQQRTIAKDKGGGDPVPFANSLFRLGITAVGRLSDDGDSMGRGSGNNGVIYMVQNDGSSPRNTLPRRKSKSGSTARTFTTQKNALPGPDGHEKAGGFLDPRRMATNVVDASKGTGNFSVCVQSNPPQRGLQGSLSVLNDRASSLRVGSQVSVQRTPAIPDIPNGPFLVQENTASREIPCKLDLTPNPASLVEVAPEAEMILQRFDGSVVDGNISCQAKCLSNSTAQGQSSVEDAKRVVHETRRRINTARRHNGSRQGKAAATDRGSRYEQKEVVEQVCTILRQSKWGPDTEEALAKLNTKLSAYHVNEVLKHQREAGLALKFFDWAKGQTGFKHDLHTYTTMVGILGRVKEFDALGLLMEDMLRDGCQPSVVTFNRLIYCYGRANYMGEALRLFHHMQEVGCKPDRVTYCTLIDLHAKAGFLDVALDLYRQMQQAGLQPDTFTYSVIINCLGKGGELSTAFNLFQEMIQNGCTPNLVTYNIIIDLHAKAGKYHVALKLYNDMQDAGFWPDQVTYSIIMEVLGNIGRIDEAELVFTEMQQAGWIPDMPVYGLLVDMWGKAGNVGKANEWYRKMLDSGLTPNVPTCNSLLGAFLRATLYDAGRRVLQDMSQWGLTPSLQTYTLLLSCCTNSERPGHHDLLWNLMANTGHSAHSFLCCLLDGVDTKDHISRFFDTISCEDQESKRGFTDAVIDFLHKFSQKAEASLVWEVATERNLYPHAVMQKAPKHWSINLHVMSMGTAVVALSRTLAHFKEQMLQTGLVPERIDIITGWGRRSRITGSSLVKQAVEEVLDSLGSPFQVESGNLGCFVGFGKPLVDWLHHCEVEQMHLI